MISDSVRQEVEPFGDKVVLECCDEEKSIELLDEMLTPKESLGECVVCTEGEAWPSTRAEFKDEAVVGVGVVVWTDEEAGGTNPLGTMLGNNSFHCLTRFFRRLERRRSTLCRMRLINFASLVTCKSKLCHQ